jgi:hypothetical protein
MYDRADAKAIVFPTAFAVIGGASRSINEDSSDVSISSEFEQARRYKNIVLYLPGSPGAKDVRVALDLMRFATEQIRLTFSLLVRQYSGKKAIYLLQLSDHEATVKNSPSMIYGDLLMVQFNLPDPGITYWDDGENLQSGRHI